MSYKITGHRRISQKVQWRFTACISAFPCRGPRTKAENNGETQQDESSVAVGFRAAYVFDISQTEGQPLPEIGSVNGDPREYREHLVKFVADHGIALEYSDDIAPARFTSSRGKIALLPGQPPAEEFATLAHEVAHEMMHRDDRRRSTSKRIRETEAEVVAFVVCSAIGLQTGSTEPRTTSASMVVTRSSSARASNTSSGLQLKFSTPSARMIHPRCPIRRCLALLPSFLWAL